MEGTEPTDAHQDASSSDAPSCSGGVGAGEEKQSGGKEAPAKKKSTPPRRQRPDRPKGLRSIMKSPKGARGKKRKMSLRFAPKKKSRSFERSPQKQQEDDDGCLKIHEEQVFVSDNVLEEELVEKATKNNLSTANVKSILHHLVSNAQVQALVRQEEGGDDIQLEYEPKLTRSKVKTVVENVAEPVPIPLWPISPKKKPKEGPQFTELPFSEDSASDEDYDPSKDELNRTTESDYESIASHQSDFGSPFPDAPSLQATPKRLPSLPEEGKGDRPPPADGEANPQDTQRESGVARAGPSGDHARLSTSDKDQTISTDELIAAMTEVNNQCFGLDETNPDGTISNRTRSKFPIEVPLEQIEASFVAPDASEDMYDKIVDDYDWQKWLASLFTNTELPDNNDDDPNDPEFNYFLENEKEVVQDKKFQKEEHRNDSAVQVPAKELQELLKEVQAEYGAPSSDQDTTIDAESWDDVIRDSEPSTSSPRRIRQLVKPSLKKRMRKATVVGSDISSEMTSDQREQIRQQLQQHIQLLTQSHLLSRAIPALQECSNQSRLYLNELNHFAEVFESQSGDDSLVSCYRVGNLAEALTIVNDPYTPAEPEETKPRRAVPIDVDAIDILAQSTVFMYPELLPLEGYRAEHTSRVVFTEPEDTLVTLGLIEFNLCPDKFELISEHMLPLKTPAQIKRRIKAVKKKPTQSIIHDYLRDGKKPILRCPARQIPEGREKAPFQHTFPKKKPLWLNNFFERHPRKRRRSPVAPKARHPAGPSGSQSIHGTPTAGPLMVPLHLAQTRAALGKKVKIHSLGDKSRRFKGKRALCSKPVAVATRLPNILPAPQPPSTAGCLITLEPNGRITINTTPCTAPQGQVALPYQAAAPSQPGGVPQFSPNNQPVPFPYPQQSPSSTPSPRKYSPTKRSPYSVLKSSPKGSSALRKYRLGRGLRQKYNWTHQKDRARRGLGFNSNSPNTAKPSEAPSEGDPLGFEDYDMNDGFVGDVESSPTHGEEPMPAQVVTPVPNLINHLKLVPAAGEVSCSDSDIFSVRSDEPATPDITQTTLTSQKAHDSGNGVFHSQSSWKTDRSQEHPENRLQDDSGVVTDSIGQRSDSAVFNQGEQSGQSHIGSLEGVTQVIAPQNAITEKAKSSGGGIGPTAAEGSLDQTVQVGADAAKSDEIVAVEAGPGICQVGDGNSEPGRGLPDLQTASEQEPGGQKSTDLCDNQVGKAVNTAVTDDMKRESSTVNDGEVSTGGTTTSARGTLLDEANSDSDRLAEPPLSQAGNENIDRRKIGPDNIEHPAATESGKLVEVGHSLEAQESRGSGREEVVGNDKQTGLKRTFDQAENRAESTGGHGSQVEDTVTKNAKSTLNVEELQNGGEIAEEEKWPPPEPEQGSLNAEDGEDGDVDMAGEEDGSQDEGGGDDNDGMKGKQESSVGDGRPGDVGGDPKKAGRRRKLVTKKMRDQMRRDAEMRKRLMDPLIIEADEQLSGKECNFPKSFLSDVKEVFRRTPEKYMQLLGCFQEFTGQVELCEKVFKLLEDHPQLIEKFTVFLPLGTAREQMRLQECLEFFKVRRFLRQVEVYFSKQQNQFEKIVNTIIEWEKEMHPASTLKKNILPLLKGQPQLLQSFLALFADENTEDVPGSRFEVFHIDSNDRQYDSYEEIELTDSEDEEQDGPGRIQPLMKSRRTVQEVEEEEEEDPYAKPRINFRRKAKHGRGRGRRSYKGTEESEGDESAEEGECPPLLGDQTATPNSSTIAVSHLSQMCDNLAEELNENCCWMGEDDTEMEAETEIEPETEIELETEAEPETELEDDGDTEASDHLAESMDEEMLSPEDGGRIAVLGDGACSEDDDAEILSQDETSKGEPDGENIINVLEAGDSEEDEMDGPGSGDEEESGSPLVRPGLASPSGESEDQLSSGEESMDDSPGPENNGISKVQSCDVVDQRGDNPLTPQIDGTFPANRNLEKTPQIDNVKNLGEGSELLDLQSVSGGQDEILTQSGDALKVGGSVSNEILVNTAEVVPSPSAVQSANTGQGSEKEDPEQEVSQKSGSPEIMVDEPPRKKTSRSVRTNQFHSGTDSMEHDIDGSTSNDKTKDDRGGIKTGDSLPIHQDLTSPFTPGRERLTEPAEEVRGLEDGRNKQTIVALDCGQVQDNCRTSVEKRNIAVKSGEETRISESNPGSATLCDDARTKPNQVTSQSSLTKVQSPSGQSGVILGMITEADEVATLTDPPEKDSQLVEKAKSQHLPEVAPHDQSTEETVAPCVDHMGQRQSSSVEEYDTEYDGISLSSQATDGSPKTAAASGSLGDDQRDVVAGWNSEMDRFILETVHAKGSKKEIYNDMSRILKNKTPYEVEARYHTLISLLQSMQNRKSEDNSSSVTDECDGTDESDTDD